MGRPIPSEMRDFVKSNGVLTLATADSEPWVCTLYYGTDDDLNLYLVSDPNSVHGKMLAKNPKVAFNIFDSHTKITDSKKGIQGKGVCSLVKGVQDTAKGLLIWHKSNPGIETKITIENVKKWKDTKIFKIRPTYLKYFDKDLYDVWEE